MFWTSVGASFDPPDVNDPRAALRVSVLDAVRDETAALKSRFAGNGRFEIIGSRVKCSGTEAVLARQIAHDGRVLKLRDEKGNPVW